MKILRAVGVGIFLIIIYLMLGEVYSAASSALVQFFETVEELLAQVSSY